MIANIFFTFYNYIKEVRSFLRAYDIHFSQEDNFRLSKEHVQRIIRQIDGKEIPFNEYVDAESIQRVRGSFNFFIGDYNSRNIRNRLLEEIYQDMSGNARKVNVLYTRSLNYFLNEKIVYKTLKERGVIYQMLISHPQSIINELKSNLRFLTELTPPADAQNLNLLHEESVTTYEIVIENIKNISSSINKDTLLFAHSFEGPFWQNLPEGSLVFDIVSTLPVTL